MALTISVISQVHLAYVNYLDAISQYDSAAESLKANQKSLYEDVKLFFMEKLNEMDEFIKARNIFKMELNDLKTLVKEQR